MGMEERFALDHSWSNAAPVETTEWEVTTR